MVVENEQLPPRHPRPQPTGGIRDQERADTEGDEDFDPSGDRGLVEALVGMDAALQGDDRAAGDTPTGDPAGMAGGGRGGEPAGDAHREADNVVKSLDENFMRIRGLGGASILGDGEVCLLLDASAVVDIVMRSRSGTEVHA